MNRFYYTFCEMDDDSFEYVVFDRRRGDNFLAPCPNSESAEKIVDALNAAMPVDLGVFG